MRTVALELPESDFEVLSREARAQNRSLPELIRKVLAQHGWGDDQRRPRLRELPVLEGVRHLKPLPSRSEIYDEIWERRGEEE